MKIIIIRNCENCFYIRNLAKDKDYPFCCVRKVLVSGIKDMAKVNPEYKIKNPKGKIPKWCPLEDFKGDKNYRKSTDFLEPKVFETRRGKE